MNYSTIRIIQMENSKYETEVFSDFFRDISAGYKTRPQPTGYFYFPETMPLQEAFDTLKAEMIKHRLQMIENLTQEVLLINAVKLEDKNEKSK